MSWENFNLDEFACRHCGKNLISHNLVDRLQSLRTELAFPFVITSGYRCLEHPNEINKSKPGTHAMGLAVDVCAERWSNANDRFDRLEELISQNTVRLWWIAGIIISLLASLVFKLIVL